jgi:hypothetical protein
VEKKKGEPNNLKIMHWFKKPQSNQSVLKSNDELQKYWRNPNEMNVTSGHLLGDRRSEYLVSLVRQYVKPDASILELGCNIGTNLNHLWKAGYHNFSFDSRDS